MVVTIGERQFSAPRSAMEITAGVALSFYGGCFMTTIAAIEVEHIPIVICIPIPICMQQFCFTLDFKGKF